MNEMCVEIIKHLLNDVRVNKIIGLYLIIIINKKKVYIYLMDFIYYYSQRN